MIRNIKKRLKNLKIWLIKLLSKVDVFADVDEDSLIFLPFSSRPRKGFIRRWKSQQVTCSSTLPRGIVFPFSGTNFLRDRHRDARYRTSQPSLDTLTLSHTNFSYSICCPFRDRFFFHLAFFYLMFLLSVSNSVLMGHHHHHLLLNFIISELLSDKILFHVHGI